MTTSKETMIDTLTRAADIIEQRGWTQGDFEDENGCVCAVGALRIALFGDTHFPGDIPDATERAYFAAHNALFEKVGFVADWNDKKGRTQDEVVATLREAAAVIA